MTSNRELKQQAFSHNNVRLFVWFRVLFNCRFYYPILAVFFVDMGLTLSQYILLNVIWAATIVLLEVPSGALADLIGRKRLVVGSAMIMVIEMALLLLAPLNGGWLLFSVCAVNRMLAGVAEAAASGADEAMSYDCLEGEEPEKQWDEVLSALARRYSLCMAIAMVSGALLYDPASHLWLQQHWGIPKLDDQYILRIPVLLCFLQGIAALMIALRMDDVRKPKQGGIKLREIMQQTIKASLWVWQTRAVCILLLGGMLTDMVARNYATLNSSYYRYIHLPEFTFGLIGAGISVCSFAVPFYAKPMARKFSMVSNLLVVALLAAAGLWGLSLFRSAWGILPALLTMLCLYHTGFLMSRFLNKLTSSEMRATVLSVKGLVFNTGYAIFSILFAQTLAWKKTSVAADDAFQSLLSWTPLFFLILVIGVWLPLTLYWKKASRDGLGE